MVPPSPGASRVAAPLRAAPRNALCRSGTALDGQSESGLPAEDWVLGGAAGSVPIGQSQRPVSGTSSIRGRDRRPTEPDARTVVDNTPGVQLAAILALDSYGPVIDGHCSEANRVGMRPPS